MKEPTETRRLLLGTIAMELGFATADQIEACAREQIARLTSEPIGRILVRKGILTEEKLTRLLEEQARRVREFSQRLRQSQKEMKRELEIAREIQRKLIPTEFPLPDGLDVAAYYMSAEALGGDFYDVGTISDGQFYVVIGDVSGKGIPAALVMSMTIGLVKLASTSTSSPTEILQQANLLLEKHLKRGTFITMVYMSFDTKRKRARVSSAGHNPPILLTKKGNVQEVAARGMALGMVRPERFYAALNEMVIDLSAVQRIVLYTDGITEAMNAKKQKFGKERLFDIVRASKGLTSKQLVDRVLLALGEHCGGGPPQDDVALVVFGLP